MPLFLFDIYFASQKWNGRFLHTDEYIKTSIFSHFKWNLFDIFSEFCERTESLINTKFRKLIVVCHVSSHYGFCIMEEVSNHFAIEIATDFK